MAVADDLKAALVDLQARVEQEIAAHLATNSSATAAQDANNAALNDALTTVRAIAEKLPPIPPPAPAA